MKFVLRATIVTLIALLSPTIVNATVIVDVSMEDNLNGWSSTGGWYDMESGFFNGYSHLAEGGRVTHSNPGHVVSNADVSLGNHTLQQGLYSIYFAMGSYNNARFPNMSGNFAGMDSSLASSSSTPAPGRGQWNLWTYTWAVEAGNVHLGNLLSFTSVASGGSSNGAIDGVGTLSSLGNGFIVDFVGAEPVSEPSLIALFSLGLLGLGFARRRQS
jgi:hypothetical protein